MIIQCKWFCKLLGVNGITLFPFIFVNNKANAILINHEKIHLAQQKELYILPFYYLYLSSYFKNRKLYKDSYLSYRNIYFEKEAYKNQDNLLYLKTREKKAYNKYLNN